jgi:phosphonate transport system substrate-binding protein
MFKFSTSRVARTFGLLLVFSILAAMLAACGDPTATTAPAATTAAATTAAATTAAATTTAAPATTAAATTAAAMTTAAGTTAASGKISLAKVRLGLIPAENATSTIENAKPFAAAIEKELGVPVELFVGNNYTATIEALASAKIDIAWFGPFSYVLASDKYNAEAILLQLGSKGETSYQSFIITNPKTGINTLADLKGKSFSFVDPASTSGNLIPRYTLTKAGLNPDTDVKGVFAGGHDASLLGVIAAKTDAGAVASDIYQKLMDEGKFKAEEIKIVAKSDPIPNSPIAVRKELSAADKKIIQQALLKIKDPAALKAIISSGFIETTNSTYDGLRDIAKVLNLDLTKLK